MNNNIIIRSEKEKEFEMISHLVKDSFAKGTDYSDGKVEIDLINEIRSKKYYIPNLAFVAEKDGILVGYFLFSRFPISNKYEDEILLLSPVAVNYKYLRQGIGKIMITKGLKKAKELGFKGVIVEGNPAFYHTIGFKISTTYGIYPSKNCHLPSPECLMALELYKGALSDIKGEVDYNFYKSLI